MQQIPCAGGVVFDEEGRLLVIQRAHPPAAGSWSVPGGRCLPGESTRDACVREVCEETGLHVAVDGFAGRVYRAAPDGRQYSIDDFVCTVTSGVLRAGDDALAARWVTRAELGRLELAPQLWATLVDWGLLPR